MNSLNHIVLIGFMGCGKTTVGKELAHTTGFPLFDTDHVIEQLKGQRIAEIFAAEGEAAFRKFEHEVLVELLNNPEQSIIVCGGGTPCFHNNMELLVEKATTIYLQASPKLLYYRLRKNTAKRPVLQNQPDLQKYISELLAQREPVYRKAEIVIDVEWKEVSTITQEITNCLGIT